jgi:hypothetical protein
MWLREALAGDDEEVQVTVFREVVTKVEVRFVHERAAQPHGSGSGAEPGIRSDALRPARPRSVLLVHLGLAKSGSRRCSSPCQ